MELAPGTVRSTSEQTGTGIVISLDTGALAVHPGLDEVHVEIAEITGFSDRAWMVWRPGEDSFEDLGWPRPDLRSTPTWSSPGHRPAPAHDVEKVLTVDDLKALPRHSCVATRTCMQGWSATSRWTGVRLTDAMDLLGPRPEDAR